MIDFNSEIEKIYPINVKEIELNRNGIDLNIKKSIILYNTAIGEMKKGNFCQAIYDLKKAISYNKDFTDAIKFMGLCYVKMNEYKKAEKVFKSLNKYEIYEELVNEYLQSLGTINLMYTASTVATTVDDLLNDRNKQFAGANGPGKKIAMCLLIIIIFIMGVGINYFYPEIVRGALTRFKSNSNIQTEQAKSEGKNDEDIDSNKYTNKNSGEEATEALAVEKKIDGAETKDIMENGDNNKVEADNYKKETINMLNDVEKAVNTENYERAAGILIDMQNRNFEANTKSIFNQLWQSLKPNPIWKIYNAGNKLYKENKYKEALPKLIIASEFIPNADIMPWLTYQIGMCYKETNDKANALAYFNKVKNDYPKSEYVSYANSNICEIGI